MTILQATPKIGLRYAFLALPFLFSCNEKPESVEKTETTPTELTIEQKKQVLQQVTPTTTKTTNSQGVALNPPHGQPNHRCDIKVGEPLNTPAASSNTTSGNGGINPPHGQPGHRCDIKVGDPL